MRQGILRLLVVLLVGSCFSPASFANFGSEFNPVANDQVLPWPWAMRCPFPWGEIDGNWHVNAGENNGEPTDRFEFKTEYKAIDGTHFFEVKRYDHIGNLTAHGRGFSPKNVELIRVAMIELDGQGRSSGNNYWAFFGAYQQDSTASCSANVTTVITTRSMNNVTTPKDIHYVVSKVPVSEEEI